MNSFNFLFSFLRLAKQASIPEYDKLPKESLFQKLKQQFDIDRLLRTEARHGRFESIHRTKKRKNEEDGEQNPSKRQEPPKVETSPPVKKVKLNTIDPIMMVPIGKKKCFKFVRPNGTIIRFNIESLVDYLLSSGDFNDPETRIPFSDADLTEIDAIVRVLIIQFLTCQVFLTFISYLIQGEEEWF